MNRYSYLNKYKKNIPNIKVGMVFVIKKGVLKKDAEGRYYEEAKLDENGMDVYGDSYYDEKIIISHLSVDEKWGDMVHFHDLEGEKKVDYINGLPWKLFLETYEPL